MRYFFLGAPIVEPAFIGWKNRMIHLGHNTGNLLIGQSLYEQLDVSYHDGGSSSDPEWINESFDCIAIACSNFLFRGFDMGYLADVIEKTTLPCLVVGLGAQAPNDHSVEFDLPQGTLRFLRIIAERSTEIGVRGSFTADALDHLGIKNVRIVGCPSLFRSRRPEIKIQKRERKERTLRVAVNGSRDIVSHAASPHDAARIQRQLFELAVKLEGFYVLQSEVPEIPVHLSRGPVAPEIASQIAAIQQALGLQMSSDELISFLRRRCRVFFDVDSWDQFIREIDLSIDSRFHGNVIALTNGIPAIILTHDSRTQELAELIQVPRYRNTDISSIDIERLYDQADYSNFEQQYSFLYHNFKEFLIRNNAAHRLL